MGLISRVKHQLFGYDAVATKPTRRKAPVTTLRSEDAEQTSRDRRALVATTRDLARNFSVAAWAIRKHLDYVSTFSFQSKTGDTALDTRIEELVAWWSRPQNFDVAGRHGRHRFTKLLETSRTRDGDVLTLKMADGRLQAIEGDRIRVPDGGFPSTLGLDPDEFVHGVQVDRYGAARAYSICKRNGDRMEFDRILRATFTVPLGYYERFDQVRGVSPLSTAINPLRDVYDNIDLALAKAKVQQLFAMVITSQAADAVGINTPTEDTDGDGTEDDKYECDVGKGPVKLEMDPGDDAKFLTDNTPSSNFQDFMSIVIAVGLKALDIPYTFYDATKGTYSANRQDLLIYEQSAANKRADVRDVLDNLTAWRLGLFIADGILELPAGMQLTDLAWEWQPHGLPWIDPLKEVNADVEAVRAGLASVPEVTKRRGRDAFDIADEQAEYLKYRESIGLPPLDTATTPEPPSEDDNSDE